MVADKITKDVFIERLKENKYFEDFEEHTKYRLDCVQFFISNHNAVYYINGKLTAVRNITINSLRDTDEMALTNLAFEGIRMQILTKV